MMSSQANVPYLTTEQMIEVDRAMIEDYHIELIQMMENAGRNLAHWRGFVFWMATLSGRQSLLWREVAAMAAAR
jgi:hypothetical protein